MSEKKVTFELTIAEINLILECLSKLPFIDVFAIINNLQSQFKKHENQPTLQEVLQTKKASE